MVYIEALYGPTTYRHIGPHVWELGGWQDQFYGIKDGHFYNFWGKFFQTATKTRQIAVEQKKISKE